MRVSLSPLAVSLSLPLMVTVAPAAMSQETPAATAAEDNESATLPEATVDDTAAKPLEGEETPAAVESPAPVAPEEVADPVVDAVAPTEQTVAPVEHVVADLEKEEKKTAAPAAPGVRCPPGLPCFSQGDFALWPRARIRTGYDFQQPDGEVLFIGENDGFYLEQARFGFGASYKNLVDAVLIVDAAAALPGARPNEPVQPQVTRIVDAFVRYQPLQFISVSIGQQFMPGAMGSTISRALLNFTGRSMVSDGIRAGRGFQVNPLANGRDIGVVVGADDAKIGPIFLDYLAGIGTGNDPATYGNDNKLPAGYFRLGAGYERYVTLGFGGAYNPRTVGTLPNLYDETDIDSFVDLRIDAFGFDILTQALWRWTSFDSLFPDVEDPNRSTYGLGLTSWIVLDEPFGVPTLGFKPAYRIAYMDPTTAFPDDQLIENTVALRWDPSSYDLPFALIADVTNLMSLDETGSIDPLRNNRFTIIGQFNF